MKYLILTTLGLMTIILTGCSQNCLEYTKVKKVTPVQVALHPEYLVEYENGTYEQVSSYSFIADKCTKYQK